MSKGSRRQRRPQRPKRPACASCKRPIRGKVHYWNHRAMDGRCYRTYTSHIEVKKPQPVRKSFWERLFGM